ncbi:type II toxin-antitoxin system CcdA family antitoxin [Endozoicomonas gorgoniicola]|uniref:Type II toxin-antitoxin system CcdA family antitoxin n=1 Tax=Endozoicomonas gorgoniicola TaxID=1234144 RepID=A0ABT3MZD7_9GAMM|nr:type II toxin-antitoxin system CcdA family antitoxin [Endozoicomonas gorgoniicola]MCW7554735.1 type II toxin-antitoxin system CcdA family antitoxin [Endozoicomonas gorgoniicola]
MTTLYEPSVPTSPVHLEVDALLLQQAESQGINISSLIEQTLRTELSCTEPAPADSSADHLTIYHNLIGEHPVCCLGLRHYFRKK